MENKNTKELRGYKAGLKSKLMGAVAMLLVSAIMVSSATYAWFVLSTHPEVKGMSTTVGSNGALEIALLNNETGALDGLSKITTKVGDSSAVAGKVKEANVTWGNLVDLSDTSYGLSQITLYPAQLTNLNGLTRGANLLSYAIYGTDGRVATLEGETGSGTYTTAGFVSDTTSYGVRAIGSAVATDPFKNAFNTAVTQYGESARAAVTYANKAFADNLQTLVNIAIAASGDDSTITKTNYTAINTALAGLQDAESSMEMALKYAIAARENEAAGNKTGDELKEESIVDASTVTLNTSDPDYGTYIGQLNQLKAGIAAAQEEMKDVTDPTATWAQIRGPYDSLIALNTMTFRVTIAGSAADYTYEQLKALDRGTLMSATAADVTINSGLFKEMAQVTGTLSGKVVVGIAQGTGTAKADDTTLKANTDGLVSAYKEPTGRGGNGTAYITTTYGYAVDLAFKTNAADRTLCLSAATSRVAGSDEAGVQGSGSTFTFGGAVDETVIKALRVAFVDGTGAVKTVAKLNETSEEGTTATYALKTYPATALANGTLTLGDANENNEIMALTADTPTALTAIVYLDGSAVDGTANRAEGKLNLQFCVDGLLKPMDYKEFNYGVSVDETTTGGQTGVIVTGQPGTLTAGTKSGTITATYNKQEAGLLKQDFVWTSGDDTVITVGMPEGTTDEEYTKAHKNTAVLEAVGAGKTTVTVTYGRYSASFEVIVPPTLVDAENKTVAVGGKLTAPTVNSKDTAVTSGLEWTSSNTKVAAVDTTSGEVTGMSAGTATITVSYKDATASYTIKVTAASSSEQP